MCGIAGLWRPKADLSPSGLEERLLPLLLPLQRRGPDGAGVWLQPEQGLALGQRRLKMMALDSSGLQPCPTPQKRHLICYNGEIYNYRELRPELEAAGYVFVGTGDVEVVAAAVDHWGVERALDRFEGMFALAVWDGQEKRLFLARDRAGEKPLYYGRCGLDFVFSSDLRSFRQHPGFQPRVSRAALTYYLRFGCVPSPYSIYEGVHKLAAARLLEVSADLSWTQTTYWSLPLTPSSLPPAEQEEQVHRLLQGSVRRQLQAAVPIGVFLSGGVDSSLVAALAQAQMGTPLKSFTIGFEKAAIDEAPYSREVARYLGCHHQEHYMTRAEALQQVLELSEIYDEPFADSSQIATAWVSRLARGQVKGVLTGDGSDELFLGYSRYALTLKKWASGHGRDLQELFLGQTTLGYLQPQQVLAFEASPHEDYYSDAPESLEPARLLSYWDLFHYLPNDILVKVDRASMAFGLEARAPFLSRELMELAFALPVGEVSNKVLLKNILAGYLPRPLFERRKQGFEVPLGEWLRGPLREWAEQLLEPQRLADRGCFRPEPIQAMWREQLEGAEHNHQLWVLLMFQQWAEQGL